MSVQQSRDFLLAHIPIVKSGSHEYPEDVVTFTIGKNFFYQQAKHSIEYLYDVNITKDLLIDLKEAGADLLTFVQRTFLNSGKRYGRPFWSEDEPIALLNITSFDKWWNFQIRSEERNRTRKALKKGITVKIAKIDTDFVRSAQRIYNETPIRQGRKYTGYGLSLKNVKEKFNNLNESEVHGAYYNGELVGLLWMIYGDSVARIKSFVSLTKHRDKAPNNALLTEAVKRAYEKNFRFVVYEKMGYLPSLDLFKAHNGFREHIVLRYYLPLSRKGVLAMKLGAYKGIQYFSSPRASRALLPAYSLATRIIPLSILQRL
jgi:hypothetical protein